MARITRARTSDRVADGGVPGARGPVPRRVRGAVDGAARSRRRARGAGRPARTRAAPSSPRATIPAQVVDFPPHHEELDPGFDEVGEITGQLDGMAGLMRLGWACAVRRGDGPRDE